MYQPQWFSWILQGSERVGLLCCKPYDNALHVHLLIIFPQYQGRQLGSAVMDRLHREAERDQEFVSLSRPLFREY